MAEWHMPIPIPTFRDTVPGCGGGGDMLMACDPSTTSMLSGWYLPPVKQEYGDVTDYDPSGNFVVTSSQSVDQEEPVPLCYHVQTMDCDPKGMLASPVVPTHPCLRSRSSSMCPPNPANPWRPTPSPPPSDSERKERETPPSAIPKNFFRTRSASVCYATSPWKVNATSPIPRSISPQLTSSTTKSFKLLSRSLSTIQETIKQRLRDVITKPEASNISADKKMRDLCQYYMTLIPCDRATFLKTLAADFAVDHSLVLYLANNLSVAQERGATILLKCEERLRHALIPRYQQLFTQISRLESGVKFLVDMRTDLLNILMPGSVLHDDPYIQTMNCCLRDLLSLWFSVGFLTLERITWQSSCDILQKISEYEAVHPIRNWTDLKRRVGPYRRCFIFTHKSMPREPVVVLHTALTDNISQSIQTIVEDTCLGSDTDSDQDELSEDPERITTVMFYSITSTQKGLQGVEMGNYLIKSVVQEMLAEFPKMQQFSSLSPIPGFKDWLVGEISKYVHQHEIGEDPMQTLFTNAELTEIRSALYSPLPEKTTMSCLKEALQKNNWASNESMVRALKTPLLRNCAHYLYAVKRRNFAYNPVAHFHLRNGAVMWRLNWRADTSPRGIGVSCGIMVNYRYFLEEAEENSSAYMEKHVIAASTQFLELIKDLSKHSEAKPSS